MSRGFCLTTNPFEILWQDLKQDIYAQKPSNVVALKQQIIVKETSSTVALNNHHSLFQMHDFPCKSSVSSLHRGLSACKKSYN